MSDSREAVLTAARRLFAQRGYPAVTIREIAVEAGVSPALVMKLGISKQRLYDDATPPDPRPLDPDWPQDRVGRELVGRIVERRDGQAAEPWLQALLGIVDSPRPADARRQFRDHYVAKLLRRLGDDPAHEPLAEVIASMLVGLAAGLRTLGLLETERDWIIERYGAMIQSLVDDAGSAPD
ncbi:MAG: TetR family transcriptional regulator [Actinomycetota bacterium]|nr:TetR family transcriptional regulator [Actinomycetota bacterium]